MDFIQNEYAEFNVNSFLLFKDKDEEEKLLYILNKDIDSTKIVTAFIALLVQGASQLSLFLSVLKSNHIEQLIEDKHFNYYLNSSASGNKEKKEIKTIINNYHLSKKLEKNLTKRMSNEKQKKI